MLAAIPGKDFPILSQFAALSRRKKSWNELQRLKSFQHKGTRLMSNTRIESTRPYEIKIQEFHPSNRHVRICSVASFSLRKIGAWLCHQCYIRTLLLPEMARPPYAELEAQSNVVKAQERGNGKETCICWRHFALRIDCFIAYAAE